VHNFRIYWTSLYMFRTAFPSIVRSSRLYTQHQVHVIQVSWLLASGHEMEHLMFRKPAVVPLSNKGMQPTLLDDVDDTHLYRRYTLSDKNPFLIKVKRLTRSNARASSIRHLCCKPTNLSAWDLFRTFETMFKPKVNAK